MDVRVQRLDVKFLDIRHLTSDIYSPREHWRCLNLRVVHLCSTWWQQHFSIEKPIPYPDVGSQMSDVRNFLISNLWHPTSNLRRASGTIRPLRSGGYSEGWTTRSHSEHDRENPLRRWYYVLRHGRVERRQFEEAFFVFYYDGWSACYFHDFRCSRMKNTLRSGFKNSFALISS